MPSRAEPLDAAHAVHALALLRPSPPDRRGRSGTACPAPRSSEQVVGEDLDVQQHDVDVEEEVQVDVRDRQRDRRVARSARRSRTAATSWRRNTRIGESAAPAACGSRRSRLAVEESLHVRQERDELVVVALLELGRVAAELVDHLAPRDCRRRRLAALPSAAGSALPPRSGISCSGHSRICRKCRTCLSWLAALSDMAASAGLGTSSNVGARASKTSTPIADVCGLSTAHSGGGAGSSQPIRTPRAARGVSGARARQHRKCHYVRIRNPNRLGQGTCNSSSRAMLAFADGENSAS